MSRRFRPRLALVATALLGLIALLATLQYRWLGQISEAERDRLRASLNTGAQEFAQDVDRELTRAFLLFQPDIASWVQTGSLDERFAARYDRWQGSARFPRLLKEFYVFAADEPGVPQLRRFDPANRRFEPADWPPSMADWRERLILGSDLKDAAPGVSLVLRKMPSAIWESVPALVVPMPFILMNDAALGSGPGTRSRGDGPPDLRRMHASTYSILTIDQGYLTSELLPSLVDRHFTIVRTGHDFRVAVVSRDKNRVVFQSTASFAPPIDATGDATADLYQVRTQDFGSLAAEVRRFVSFSTATKGPAPGVSNFFTAEARPLSVVIQGVPAVGPMEGRPAAGPLSAGEAQLGERAADESAAPAL